jgi:hypothetical protein
MPRSEPDAPDLDQRTHALIDALRDLAALVAIPATIEDILSRVGERIADLLPVDGVGVLLREDDGGLLIATATSEIGHAVEELEVELVEGPCSRSFLLGRTVIATDLTAAVDDYPRFAPRALALGVRSIHALPMTFGSDQLGALDLIARDPVVLQPDQVAIAQLLVDVTTSYIVNNRMLEEQSTLARNLQRALDNRVVIEQAKGILAERHAITPVAAFELLRTHARSTRTRLADLAAEVIVGELRL